MAERSFLLPISSSQIGKRTQNARRGIFPAPEKWVHAIPAVVVFCFFVLWWFSHSVSIDINNGQILAFHRIENSLAVTVARNDTRLDMAILASSAISRASDFPSGNQNRTLQHSSQPEKSRSPNHEP
ncbi:PREDICTED: uncharacterized protein LOC104800629 [Tarenaya hassleriana]|uniref:uncharacterized protein LOC104800629 n=1 Tax=Tarenaya hassleriana TaxID=28532 RepID=UPI00053C7342|nr:PREDICTED: uncharacterized protein LOC104800629 [Tarenaya hassleriana]